MGKSKESDVQASTKTTKAIYDQYLEFSDHPPTITHFHRNKEKQAEHRPEPPKMKQCASYNVLIGLFFNLILNDPLIYQILHELQYQIER